MCVGSYLVKVGKHVKSYCLLCKDNKGCYDGDMVSIRSIIQTKFTDIHITTSNEPHYK